MDQEVRWAATLSDGSEAIEHTGSWTIVPGERKPWIRLCEYSVKEGLHLTSLRLEYAGKTVHLPQSSFDRFGLGGRAKAPSHYALQYHLEVDDLWGDQEDAEFVDLIAVYDDFSVHFIQDTTNGANSWIVVTDPDEIAPSPKSL